MSKMPVDRDEKQRDLFRRFGIPRLDEAEIPPRLGGLGGLEPKKPNTDEDKPEKPKKSPKQ